jgi:hypothetical protein
MKGGIIMGKIMRNGNKYSSASPNNAQSVVYDNTDSGLEAENTKEAIDELNKNLIYTSSKEYSITITNTNTSNELSYDEIIPNNVNIIAVMPILTDTATYIDAQVTFEDMRLHYNRLNLNVIASKADTYTFLVTVFYTLK